MIEVLEIAAAGINLKKVDTVVFNHDRIDHSNGQCAFIIQSVNYYYHYTY